MIRVLKRHIFKEFLRVFSITLVAFVALFLLVEIVEKSDDLIEHHASILTSVYFFLYQVPFFFCQVAPVAVLLSVLISLGTLNKHGEITAVKAGGISLTSAISPLFVAGVFMVALVIIINESVTPVANKAVSAIERKIQGKERMKFGKEGLWLRGEDGIYNVREIDLKRNILRGLTIFRLEGARLVGRTKARTAEWEDGRWVAEGARELVFSDDSVIIERHKGETVFHGLDAPENLVTLEKNYEEMSFSELKHYIRGLEKEGFNTDRYSVELYSKLTFPVVNFIMVLVGIPFALRAGRHGGIATGVGLSVIIGFSYWVIFGLSKSLGQGGIVPPLVAAAFPDVLFLAIGALMYGYVKQ